MDYCPDFYPNFLWGDLILLPPSVAALVSAATFLLLCARWDVGEIFRAELYDSTQHERVQAGLGSRRGKKGLRDWIEFRDTRSCCKCMRAVRCCKFPAAEVINGCNGLFYASTEPVGMCWDFVCARNLFHKYRMAIWVSSPARRQGFWRAEAICQFHLFEIGLVLLFAVTKIAF